ncbi:MAG: mannose-6-phosphate isomerase [Chloroflexi bacterium HGW-Chloroflexi-3]|nr:MAG: mannose-6-phosphate isomerase [Chloroflexi bacterium HGW-Chloroflexi-3]
MNNILYPLLLEPTIKNYVWGGQKFSHSLHNNPDPSQPVAEIWTIYNHNRIRNGYLSGKTLQDLVRNFGTTLLGKFYNSNSFENFPLLIKLLDSQQWLSVQVHPNDDQAVELEGKEFNGKTEGWFVLDADPGAQLIAGIKPGMDKKTLASSIQNGTITSHLQYHSIHKYDYIFIPAGTIHALGPGARVYEIQQNSDVTYRVYDWDRPASAGRPLHIEKSIAVTDTLSQGQLNQSQDLPYQNIFTCQYFSLDLYQSAGKKVELNPNHDSFHALTVIEGVTEFISSDAQFSLNTFESVLVPASYPSYQLSGNYKLLIGSLNSK